MKKTIHSKAIVAVTLLLSFYGASTTQADTFGTGSNQFTIDFTTIGNPGNPADDIGALSFGSVGYTYRIGTYEISRNQIDAARSSGLANVIAAPEWTYQYGNVLMPPAWSGDQPANYISWYEAAAFVNWLNTSTGHQSAYNISYTGGSWSMSLWSESDPGYNSVNAYRNFNAYYFLPTMDEWYKAAYGKSDGSGFYYFPTASDTWPTAVASGTTAGTAVFNQPVNQGPASVYAAGGLSSYGTMAQGGNSLEWNESASLVGGDWQSTRWSLNKADSSKSVGTSYPSYDYWDSGFRVASVTDFGGISNPGAIPEPSTYALLGLGGVLLLISMRRRASAQS